MKKFRVLLIFVVLSLMGTAATDFCLGLWVLDNNDSTVTYSVISFIIITPQVLLSPFMGSLVDRWNKKKTIIFGQLIAGLSSLALMLLYLGDGLEAWHIMVVSLFSSVANAFVFQAFYVVTVTMVPKSKLSQAKGLERAAFSLVAIGVPMAAPFLYKSIDLNGIFLIDVITFTASILAFIAIKFGEQNAEKSEDLAFRRDAKLVWNFLTSTKGYLPLLVYFFIIQFTLGILALMLAPLVMDIADEHSLGLIMTMAGLGTLGGGILMMTWKGFDRAIRGVILLNIVIGVLLFSIPFKMSILTLGILVIVVMFFNTIINSTNAAFWHTIIPFEIQGRVLGYQMFLLGLATPLAYLTAGFLVDYVLSPLIFEIPIAWYADFFVGTSRTMCILFLFLAAGAINFFVSVFLRNKAFVKQVDDLYIEKKYETQPPKEDEQELAEVAE